MKCPIGLDPRVHCKTCLFVLANGRCDFKTFRDKKQEEDLKAMREASKIRG